MRKIFAESLIQNARVNENLMLITGDLGFGVFEKFIDEFPKQYLNAGITEQSMISLASGMAAEGHQVFVYSIANFPTFRCLEQIRNDVCAREANVTIVSVGAGYDYGSAGYTHHGIEDIAVMRCLPNMEIYTPYEPDDVPMIVESIVKNGGPSYLRLGRNKLNVKFEPKKNTNIIQGRKIFEGNEGSILVSGGLNDLVNELIEKISTFDIKPSIYKITKYSEIDYNFLKTISSQGQIITVEEHVRQGGFGSFILEKMNEYKLTCRLNIVAVNRNNLNLIGSSDFLRMKNGLTSEAILELYT